ncbi:hypothetical protein EVU97_14020, partial [Dermacoccus sp. 147Ba]
MFDAKSWFALGIDNRRVAGVPVTSLKQGLDLIEDGGRVTSIVGTLHRQFIAIDVDVPGLEGHAITENLAGWCEETGLWHLIRPSGGAEGRHHVIVAPHGQEILLRHHVEALRARYRVAKSHIDIRSSLRPLSAPHRRGGCPTAYGDLAHALSTLQAFSDTTPAQPHAKLDKPPSGRRLRTIEPLTPKRRYAPRALPEKWATYLSTGRRPAWRNADNPELDTSNSTWELMCTAEMMRSGWEPLHAWNTIQTCHPAAMERARKDYHRWVTGVWNAAVKADDEFQPRPRTSPHIRQATQEATDRLRTYAWSLSPRERVALLVVAHVILRRIEREDTLRVPCPERDLVLDTGIKDRKTIRKQLQRLDGVLGTRDTQAFDVARRASSSYE